MIKDPTEDTKQKIREDNLTKSVVQKIFQSCNVWAILGVEPKLNWLKLGWKINELNKKK